MSDPLADCGHCTLSPTVSGKPARATQATCPVHGTPPYAPLSAPSASSQALPADQAHPAVRAGQDAYMELLRTGDGCPGSHDVAAAVAPAVLLWAGRQFVAAAERHAASGCSERLAVASGKYAAAAMAATWADEIVAASSVPTGTRDPAVRWWTHGSCGPAPGNADDQNIVRQVAGPLCRSGVHHSQLDFADVPCAMCVELAEFAVVALVGRLLPADAEMSEQWSVRKSSVLDGDGVGLPYNTRAPAEQHLARFVGGMHPYPVEAELVRRDVRRWSDGAVWVGPWLPAPTNTEESA